MGFQVEENKEPRYFTRDEEANGPFDQSRGFEMQQEGTHTPLNIVTKKDQVFGMTSNMN